MKNFGNQSSKFREPPLVGKYFIHQSKKNSFIPVGQAGKQECHTAASTVVD